MYMYVCMATAISCGCTYMYIILQKVQLIYMYVCMYVCIDSFRFAGNPRCLGTGQEWPFD